MVGDDERQSHIKRIEYTIHLCIRIFHRIDVFHLVAHNFVRSLYFARSMSDQGSARS